MPAPEPVEPSPVPEEVVEEAKDDAPHVAAVDADKMSAPESAGHVSKNSMATASFVPSPAPIMVPLPEEPPKRAVTVLPSRDLTGGLGANYVPPPRSSPSTAIGFRPPPPPAGPHPPSPPPPVRPPAHPAPYSQSYSKPPPSKYPRWEESRAPRPMYHTNTPRQPYVDNPQRYGGPDPSRHHQTYAPPPPPGHAPRRMDSNEELEEGEER